MARHDPLRRYLAGTGRHEVELGFEQTAAMVPGGLPPSVYDPQRRIWWTGSPGRSPAWRSATPSARATSSRARPGPDRPR